MRGIIPGKGWASVVNWTESGAYYGILGPFAEGDYIRRLEVMVTGAIANNGRFCASLGRSSEATVASLRSGIPLIQRSTFAVGGVPVTFWAHGAFGQTTFVLPVGIGGDVGSRYVVFMVNPLGADVDGCGLVGAEVLRFSKAEKD